MGPFTQPRVAWGLWLGYLAWEASHVRMGTGTEKKLTDSQAQACLINYLGMSKRFSKFCSEMKGRET